MTLALLLVLLAAPAPDALRDSQSKYELGDFEGALAILDAAVRVEGSSERAGLLHLSRARCLAALRRNAELDPALEAALVADPALTAGADDSPGFRATFDRARARLAGTLKVDSTPPGAAVRIDGALVGRAPITQLLPVGRYQVGVLDESGTEVARREVVVSARQTQSIVLSRPVVAVGRAEPPAAIEAPARWPMVPTFSARVVVDPRAGAAFEVGLGVLARYWLVELDAIAGGAAGVGARAGLRLAFLRWLSVQATLDGAAFFASSVLLGAGGTVSLVVSPTAFLDVSVDGSARFVQPSAVFRSDYGLVGLTVRLRWPRLD